MAFVGSLSQVGLSGQAKYWFDIPDTSNRLKLVRQGGLGFLHADRLDADTSWLVPLGVGFDYVVTEKLTMTANFLINFTDIDTAMAKTHMSCLG